MRRNHLNPTRIACAVLAAALLSISALAQMNNGGMNNGVLSPPANTRPPRLQNVGIEQHLDAQVPADLVFRDETGKTVKLGDYFGHKPLILNLVYYNCTMLCGEALAGLSSAMRLIKFDVGNEFDVITVSFDPRETPEMAAAKKIDYVKRYGRASAAAGWHFLTGQPDSINALTKAVGFQYQYDEKSNQYAHATAIMVLTPEGRISRYFYGVDFPPKDLRMGLVEASQGKIGNAVDAVLLYCYHYNPETGKYGALVGNILRLAAGATILLLGGLIFILWRLDRAATSKAASRKTATKTRYA
ncbi:MAG TPA: SCO family protein [Candidatus Aquilonibacter sp.]|nr:SCO family protein [Candidatus Aquilonibacter sp.]